MLTSYVIIKIKTQRKDGRKPGKVKDMTFDDLIVRRPKVIVADIIQLFLLGDDDKIYITLAEYNNGEYVDLLKNERIIHEEWEKYYDCNIKWIEENYEYSIFTIVI